MIFPLFNERHAIGALVRRVPPEIAETIVVDDGSDDGGPDLAREGGARVIAQDRRRGVGAAIRTGIKAARANGHGAVVILAANGKDDPAEAPRLIEKLEAGYAWAYRHLFSLKSIWARRPAQTSSVIPYLGMSLLYKKSNWLWPFLIQSGLTATVWRPLVEASRLRHLVYRRKLRRRVVVTGDVALLKASSSTR